MTKWMPLALGMLFLVPLAGAHAAPDPLDNEPQIIGDETSDDYALYDGFDLQTVFMRDAFMRTTQEHGVIVRFLIYGGFGPAPVATTMHLDFTVTANEAEKTFRLSTTDGRNWTGDLMIVDASFEAEATGALGGSVQAFISYGQLGIERGDALSGFLVESYADADLRDIAPGPRPIPGTGGQLVVDEESSAAEEYIVTGADTYTASTASIADDVVTVSVENRISVVGQHILVEPVGDGWHFGEVSPAAASVEPGTHPEFTFPAHALEDPQAIVIAVTTDLGGYEVVTLSAEGIVIPECVDADCVGTPDPEPTDDQKDSPGFGLIVAIAAVATVAIIRRSAASE